MDQDLALREAAIRHCRLLSLQWGEAVPYAELARGFPFAGGWIKLVGPQGVFKPKEMSDGPLTLLSTLASSYEDEHLEGDEVLYDYAPRSREHENDGLKRIASQGKPVILLKQVKSKPRLPEGVAWVRNGLAMCPTHHRAYDQNLLIVTESYRVEVRDDRLGHVGSEATRRMLLDYHGREIIRSKDEQLWPEPGLLRRKIELAA